MTDVEALTRVAALEPRVRMLPFTLPSLVVAVLHCPAPMSEEDYDYMLKTITSFRAALVRPKETP